MITTSLSENEAKDADQQLQMDTVVSGLGTLRTTMQDNLDAHRDTHEQKLTDTELKLTTSFKLEHATIKQDHEQAQELTSEKLQEVRQTVSEVHQKVNTRIDAELFDVAAKTEEAHQKIETVKSELTVNINENIAQVAAKTHEAHQRAHEAHAVAETAHAKTEEAHQKIETVKSDLTVNINENIAKTDEAHQRAHAAHAVAETAHTTAQEAKAVVDAAPAMYAPSDDENEPSEESTSGGGAQSFSSAPVQQAPARVEPTFNTTPRPISSTP